MLYMKENYSIHWKCVRSKIYVNNTFLTQYVSNAMGERWGEKSLLQRLGNLMAFGGNGRGRARCRRKNCLSG